MQSSVICRDERGTHLGARRKCDTQGQLLREDKLRRADDLCQRLFVSIGKINRND